MLASSHQAWTRRLLRAFAQLRHVAPPHSASKADALPTELDNIEGLRKVMVGAAGIEPITLRT
jgi:hypothetical protein